MLASRSTPAFGLIFPEKLETIMRVLSVLAVAVLLVLGLGVTIQTKEQPDAREELATAIPAAIRLLNEEKYEDFVRSYMDPKEIDRFDEEQLKTFVEGFAVRKAPRILKILKAIEGKKPELDEKGGTATFEHGLKIGPEDAPSSTIIFKKVEKFWYIEN